MADPWIGLIGVAMGACIAALFQWERDQAAERRRRRTERMEVYTDALRLTQDMASSLNWLTEHPLFRGSSFPRTDLPIWNDVSARLQLRASERAWKAWEKVVAAHQRLQWASTEEFDQDQNGPVANESDQAVTAARSAIRAFTEVVRADIDPHGGRSTAGGDAESGTMEP